MSNIHNNGENEKSLGESLDKLGRAYDRLSHDEPPELLDQAILNSARRAVEKKPHWLRFGWLHGLTTAAVFLLALSIIINQREQLPVYESGGRDNELSGLQRQKTAKKQSADAPSADMRMELKEKAENRRDGLQNAPESAPLKTGVAESDMGDPAPQPVVQAQRTTIADSLQAKKDHSDADVQDHEPVPEAQQADEAELILATPAPEVISKQSPPAATAGFATGEIGRSVETDIEIEKILQDIIRLKESGDEAWISQLESFKRDYPGYPLPEALSD